MNINNAIDEIKKIECPTGELENRVAGILADYDLENITTDSVHRDKSLDERDGKAFCVDTTNVKLVIMATSGLDDYVAKVVHVYVK
jgi:hypothetical protein